MSAQFPLILQGDVNWCGGSWHIVSSPWDGSTVAEVQHAGAREVKLALDWAAARTELCAEWLLEERLRTLLKWAAECARHAEEIAQLETREMGKPIRQTRAVMAAIVRRIELLCAARRDLQGEFFGTDFSNAAQHVHAFSMREPYGLVAGILPFNSPVSALVWKVAPALLMGNAVLIKVSEKTPLAALRAAQLLAALPLPEGALQVANGDGSKLGPVISEHARVSRISFTGGTEAGIDIFRRSAATMKRLTLECGSCDALLVLKDADLALAARTVVNIGIRTYSGQICVAPKSCIVQQEVYHDFVDALLAEAGRVVQGDPLEESTELGPLVNEAAAAQAERQIQDGVAQGASLLCGGRRSAPAFLPPTVLGDVSPENPFFREGVFGPVVALTIARDENEAVALANDSPYAIRSAIFSCDIRRATELARRLDCGGVAINGPAAIDNPRVTVEPRKLSGLGSEGIHASLLEYSQSKFIWINDWWPRS